MPSCTRLSICFDNDFKIKSKQGISHLLTPSQTTPTYLDGVSFQLPACRKHTLAKVAGNGTMTHAQFSGFVTVHTSRMRLGEQLCWSLAKIIDHPFRVLAFFRVCDCVKVNGSWKADNILHFSRIILVYYYECCNLIGYSTHYVFLDR